MNQVSILEKLINDLEIINNKLYHFLVDCGVHPNDRKLSTLVGLLDDILVIKGNKKYLGVQTNKQGYVTDVIVIDGVLEYTPMPDDVEKGYYKLIDNKLVVDEKMKVKLWEV